MNLAYVREERQGLSHARNRGIAEALAECVVFLDDDIRATPQLIPAWLSFFSNHSTAVAGGGKIHVQFDDPRPAWMSHFLLPLLGQHDLGNSFKKYPLNSYPFGGNMGFRKHLFDTYGTFKTNLGRIGKELYASEEKELFRRIRAGEQEIYYLPEALLYHRVNKSRLTVDYIRQQALGLGRSIAVQLQYASYRSKIMAGFQEFFKFAVSLGLFLPYMFTFQPSKAVMLLKFRKWIVKGYFSK
jgi:glycosyltransferase involved in cell wall biosynthesis